MGLRDLGREVVGADKIIGIDLNPARGDGAQSSRLTHFACLLCCVLCHP
jgi:hypothetical protein